MIVFRIDGRTLKSLIFQFFETKIILNHLFCGGMRKRVEKTNKDIFDFVACMLLNMVLNSNTMKIDNCYLG